MTYDLAFWHGPRPRDDAAAGEEFERRMDALDADDHVPQPPTSRIRALVDRLETRWPMPDAPPWPPWASWPLGDDADGEVLYVSLTFEGAEAAAEMAVLAGELGLVCYDPQGECLV